MIQGRVGGFQLNVGITKDREIYTLIDALLKRWGTNSPSRNVHPPFVVRGDNVFGFLSILIHLNHDGQFDLAVFVRHLWQQLDGPFEDVEPTEVGVEWGAVVLFDDGFG